MTGWWERAACKGMSLRHFFPERSNQTDPAKEVCALCPVRTSCIDEAAAHSDTWGIWGGEMWHHGHTDARKGQPAAYPAEVREAAVALFRQLRPQFDSEKAALVEVARALGVRSEATVRDWVAAEVPVDERRPKRDREYKPETRAEAIAMYHRTRHRYRTKVSALQAVADVHGVHPETLRDWVSRRPREPERIEATA
jgi:transposase-like protein